MMENGIPLTCPHFETAAELGPNQKPKTPEHCKPVKTPSGAGPTSPLSNYTTNWGSRPARPSFSLFSLGTQQIALFALVPPARLSRPSVYWCQSKTTTRHFVPQYPVLFSVFHS